MVGGRAWRRRGPRPPRYETLMTFTRVQCTDCDNMILPQTAAANGGLCAPCASLGASGRRERREFQHALESGLIFRPSPEERGSARQPAGLGRAATTWRLEPDF